MKQAISFYDFEQAFKSYGRGSSFTYQGLKALFEWFEGLDDDCGTETELDVVAIDCDFAEVKDMDEFRADYGEEYDTMEQVAEETTVIPVEGGGFIYQSF